MSIMRAPEKEIYPWANQLAMKMKERCSPLALKVTYKLLREARTLSFAESFQLEYRVAINMVLVRGLFAGWSNFFLARSRFSRRSQVCCRRQTSSCMVPQGGC